MDETNPRVPPHSAEAERGVLGSILLDASTVGDARVLDTCLANGLTVDSFFVPAYQTIFSTLVDMSRATVPIDILSLGETLRSTGRLEQVGGVAALQALVDGTPTAAHAEYYLDVVRRHALLRTIIMKSRKTEQRCFAPHADADADVILGEVEKDFLDIGGTTSQRLDWKSAIEETHRNLEHIFDVGSGSVDGLSTGFRDLDNTLMGLKPSDMIVLAARPSMGKTSLAMNIAECVATGTDINGNAIRGMSGVPDGTKRGVLVFSLEMSTEALARRMLCSRARVSSWRMQRGLMNPNERAIASQNLFSASAALAQALLYVDDTSGLDVMDMRARARRMKQRHDIGLIVIDYLQLCNCREYANQGRQLETSRISNQIKAMAKELQVPVIVLSQLSRANEQRGDKEEEPKMSDLRDSGAIEQDADVIMLLRRPCRTRGSKWHDNKLLAIVNVAKFRNGQTGDVDFNFDGDLVRFLNRRQGLEARNTLTGESDGNNTLPSGSSSVDPAAEAISKSDPSVL